MQYPVDPKFPITQTFAEHEAARISHGWKYYNGGIDWGCPEGTPIVAPVSGTVSFVGPDSGDISAGYGLHIRMTNDKYTFIFGHCSKIVAKVGDKVAEGQVIAYTGNTGNSTGPHLHFEVRPGTGSTSIDPMPLLQTAPVIFKAQVVAPDGVNVRSGPGTGFEKITGYPYGTKLDIIEVQGDWAKTTGQKWVCTKLNGATLVELVPANGTAPKPAPKPELTLADKVDKLWAAHSELWS